MGELICMVPMKLQGWLGIFTIASSTRLFSWVTGLFRVQLTVTPKSAARTLLAEMKIPYPLLQTSRGGFIKYKVAERPERPHYFRQMEKCNLEGSPLLGCMPVLARLTPTEFMVEME